ncbi:SGNH/GDSL hydrolase family protein [Bacillus sp. 1P06AnD]|uniref:SGNH/GDSL hydrolase family protein n=1 Tax=Bacillus sp. 1P06AnD TaxID=3132208 RepID=UPI00399FE81D
MRIICFGDSLTRGVSIVKGRMRILKDNYPALLADFFQKKEKSVEVLNKGVFNDNSDLLLARLEKDVISLKPDLAIIGIGGNDCNFRWKEVARFPDREHEAVVPLQRYIHNLKEIVSRLKQEQIFPLFLTLPPLDPSCYYAFLSAQFCSSLGHWISKVGGIEHWHGQYNRALNKWIEEEGLKKIDVRNAIKQSGELSHLISDDGIHLTSEGYHALSKAIIETIAPFVHNMQRA